MRSFLSADIFFIKQNQFKTNIFHFYFFFAAFVSCFADVEFSFLAFADNRAVFNAPPHSVKRLFSVAAFFGNKHIGFF
jgi:hypothetical protein